MRLKDTFILAELNGDIVAVPLKEKDGFHGVIRLNIFIHESIPFCQAAEKL